MKPTLSYCISSLPRGARVVELRARAAESTARPHFPLQRRATRPLLLRPPARMVLRHRPWRAGRRARPVPGAGTLRGRGRGALGFALVVAWSIVVLRLRLRFRFVHGRCGLRPVALCLFRGLRNLTLRRARLRSRLSIGRRQNKRNRSFLCIWPTQRPHFCSPNPRASPAANPAASPARPDPSRRAASQSSASWSRPPPPVARARRREGWAVGWHRRGSTSA